MEVVGAIGAAACCCACVLGMCMLSSRRFHYWYLCSRCTELCAERRRQNALISGCSFRRYRYRGDPVCQNETCPVCLDDFKTRSQVTVTPCKHGFHKMCLIGCLETSPLCPLCKTVVSQMTSAISNDHIAVTSERSPLIF